MNGGITYTLFQLQAPTVVSVLRAQPLKHLAKHLTVLDNTKPVVCSSPASMWQIGK